MKFLQILFSNNSPISASIQKQLKNIMFLENKNGWKLYGKTGWPSKIGWFVGLIEKNDQQYFFALNMDLEKFENLSLRQEIADEIFTLIIADY